MFPNHGIFISSFHDAFQSAAETLKQEVFLMKIIFARCFSFRYPPKKKTLDLNFNVSHRSWKKYRKPNIKAFRDFTVSTSMPILNSTVISFNSKMK